MTTEQLYDRRPLRVRAERWEGAPTDDVRLVDNGDIYPWTQQQTYSVIGGAPDCAQCGKPFNEHGRLRVGNTTQQFVCRGDWIIHSPERAVYAMTDAGFNHAFMPAEVQCDD